MINCCKGELQDAWVILRKVTAWLDRDSMAYTLYVRKMTAWLDIETHCQPLTRAFPLALHCLELHWRTSVYSTPPHKYNAVINEGRLESRQHIKEFLQQFTQTAEYINPITRSQYTVTKMMVKCIHVYMNIARLCKPVVHNSKTTVHQPLVEHVH